MITISIVSPQKSMDLIDRAIAMKDFGCLFHKYVYDRLEEIEDIYEQCKDSCDVMFFSGELGYSYMLTHVPDIKVPCTLISYEDKHILSILLNFVVRYPHIPLTRVYIDFLTPVNDYMNLKQYLAPAHMPYLFENPVYNYETLKERAEELWKGGKIDIMLTRTTNQLNVLNKLKIPYIHILPTEEMIRDSIKSAVNAIRSVSNRFELDMDTDLYKKSFDRIQDLISYLDQKGDLEFRLGAGFGNSLGESHYQAEKALQEAIRYGKNDGFIIHGDENVLTGPLSLTRNLNYSYSNTKALAYSQKNGINESNLLRIVGLFQMDNDAVVTAASLSQLLNITSRSCNRILQQLLDSGLIEEIEPLRQEGKGRPTRQYRFLKEQFIDAFF